MHPGALVLYAQCSGKRQLLEMALLQRSQAEARELIATVITARNRPQAERKKQPQYSIPRNCFGQCARVLRGQVRGCRDFHQTSITAFCLTFFCFFSQYFLYRCAVCTFYSSEIIFTNAKHLSFETAHFDCRDENPTLVKL